MTFKVIVAFQGNDYPIVSSKAESVKEFQKKVFEATDVPPSSQKLLFQGKFLSVKNHANLNNYGIHDGFKVQLLEDRAPFEVPKNNNENEASDENQNSNGSKMAPPPSPSLAEPCSSGCSATTSTTANNEDDLSEEEKEKRLLEIGGENLVAAIKKEDNEDQGQPFEPCKKCKKKKGRKCKECNCRVCGIDEGTPLFCDECQYYIHIYCVDPPINPHKTKNDDWTAEMKAHELLEDWYCPRCKRDEKEVVKPGEGPRLGKKALNPSNAKPQKRDWGRGMATARVENKCSIVGGHHFGPIPGIEVGMSWQYRVQVSGAGVHRPHIAGIAGRSSIGCQSIVLAGGYEDDVDNGDKFSYTGSGGRDLSGNKRTEGQSFDQTLTDGNLALAGMKMLRKITKSRILFSELNFNLKCLEK